MPSFLNPAVERDDSHRGLFTDDEYRRVRQYYAGQRNAPPTPLKRLPSMARELGLADLLAKDETGRFMLNAFKIVGVRYAVDRLGDEAAARGLVCATAGNHGRAVARVAHEKRVPCTVFVPKPARSSAPPSATADGATAPGDTADRVRDARVAAMREDGATVVDVDGTYEDAVREAADFGARTGATIVSDTSWEGYERIPRWIMAGYTHILDEAAAQWDAPPTHVIVQGGVGGLVCAAASWFAHEFGRERPWFIAAEPDEAACLLGSARAGRAVTIDSSLETIMAGLRCAAPSPVAWPSIAETVDAFVTVPDAAAIAAMRRLIDAPFEERIDAGPSGACGVAALTAMVRAGEFQKLRSAVELDRSARALLIITESP
jgi:diaminopropionate ammonia-lyase